MEKGPVRRGLPGNADAVKKVAPFKRLGELLDHLFARRIER
jgi:hypothetical protein